MSVTESAHTQWELAWLGSCRFGDSPLPITYRTLVYIPKSFNFDSILWRRTRALPFLDTSVDGIDRPRMHLVDLVFIEGRGASRCPRLGN